MFRIWAKVVNNEHIEKQTVFEREEKFSYSQFFTYLASICEALDVPTPLLLKPHVFQYAKFNRVVFRPADFAESVSFDKLVLENLL